MIIVLMGVSGAGKSTLGRALAARLSWDFIEGDDFHPAENVNKMRHGKPLDDSDRALWLDSLHHEIQRYQQDSRSAVLACSALKARYRELLAAGTESIRFVYLSGSPELIAQRLSRRENHFMPSDLLASQFAALEAPADALTVDITLSTEHQVDNIVRTLGVLSVARRQAEEPYHCETLTDGLAFPEGPRWHQGRLWFTDQHARAIYAVDLQGTLEKIADTDDLPGGLGWLPDGSLLVVYMTQRRIMRLAAGELVAYADLSKQASFHCNDMVVDDAGRIYAGNFGFDLHGGANIAPAELIRIDTDGSITTIANDLLFPNGSAITPGGDTLLVAETFAHRVTAFSLDGDGEVTGREIWAELDEQTPDGICLDAEGALWIASPGTRTLTRVKQNGAIVGRCITRGTPYACMLGGEDRRTLFVCTSETDDPITAAEKKSGRIEQTRVEVPGTGRP